MIRRIIPALAALLVCLPETLLAQDEFPPSSPEGAVMSYIEAMKEGDLVRMGKMMHPEALATFRAMMQPVVDLAEKTEGGASEMLQLFDGVTSVAQLRKLDDAKFFTSFYKGMAALQPDLLDALKGSETEVLGHIMEGDDTAHVIYRLSTTGSSAKQTEVVSLQKTKTGWGVMLTGEFEGLADALRQSVEAQQ
jgi:hypothetical protein